MKVLDARKLRRCEKPPCIELYCFECTLLWETDQIRQQSPLWSNFVSNIFHRRTQFSIFKMLLALLHFVLYKVWLHHVGDQVHNFWVFIQWNVSRENPYFEWMKSQYLQNGNNIFSGMAICNLWDINTSMAFCTFPDWFACQTEIRQIINEQIWRYAQDNLDRHTIHGN